MKKFLKTLLLGVFVAIIAVGSGVLSYKITSDILMKNNEPGKEELKMPSVRTSAVAMTNGGTSTTVKDYEFMFYIVKLEENVLNVYANYKDHEELLYGERINPYDLSVDEREMLKDGVRLEEMSQVTELTENFTS